MTNEIVIPFKPRFPQNKLMPILDAHRFSVLIMHRRAGKTVMLINQTVKRALLNSQWEPRYAYIAPFLKQAKLTTWSYWKWYTSTIPGRTVNESELYISLPNGARIYLFGADNPDAIRGPYWDGTILDEYAQIKPNVFDEIVRPALADRKGWSVFSGTPKGQNQFLEVYQTAQRKVSEGDTNWFHALYNVYDTNALDPAEVEMMRTTMPDSTFRQEFLCDFTASADNVLIPIDVVTAAAARVKQAHEYSQAPKVIGVDVARFGDDRSVIMRRQGLQAFKPKIFRGIDLMSLVGYITHEIDEWKPDAVFIDEGGMGAGVIDRLRQLNYTVTGVNFGSRALQDQHYSNKRMEIWDKCREWLEEGGCIPNDPELKADLVVPTYGFDPSNRMKLESKEDIKKRGCLSPDVAEGLVLTFSFPVTRREDVGRGNQALYKANTEYKLRR